MALSHSEAQVLYARYLKSGMTLEKFCKLHQVPYWDFSDWINQWEKLYGAKYVENSTTIQYKQERKLFSSENPSFSSNAQKIFPIEFVKTTHLYISLMNILVSMLTWNSLNLELL